MRLFARTDEGAGHIHGHASELMNVDHRDLVAAEAHRNLSLSDSIVLLVAIDKD